MFDPDLYRKTCSEGLKLSGEKLEEMIAMTENKKRGLRRPVQIALTAAALAVVMCVTAAAANPEAVQQIFKSFSVSVIYDDGSTMVTRTDVPAISVERVGDHVILMVDDMQADITEALERDGVYKQTYEIEGGSAELTVQPDLTWEINVSMKDGKEVTYSSDRFEMYYHYPADWDENAMLTPEGESFVTYTFTDDEGAVITTSCLPSEE